MNRRELLKFAGFTTLVGAGTVCSEYAGKCIYNYIQPNEEEKFNHLWNLLKEYVEERDKFYINYKDLLLNPKTPYSKIFELEEEEERIMNKILLSYCEKNYPELVQQRRSFNWRFWEPKDKDYYIDEEALEELVYEHGKLFKKTLLPDNVTKMDVLILGTILEERNVHENDDLNPPGYFNKIIFFKKEKKSLDSYLGLEKRDRFSDLDLNSMRKLYIERE